LSRAVVGVLDDADHLDHDAVRITVKRPDWVLEQVRDTLACTRRQSGW
jgi:hypothetical protein